MNEELIDAAILGDEAKKFLESDLGAKMHELAIGQVIAAQEALETVDPMNGVRITELQNQAKVARYFEQWLVELISKGEAALAAHQQQRSSE